MSLLHALLSTARSTPDKPLLRHEGQTVTYAEMAARSRQAADLLQQAGVGPGERVALMCLNTPAFIECLFGAWRLGAAVVPINHKLMAPEVDYILRHSESKVLVFDAALAGTAQALQAPLRKLSTEGDVSGVANYDRLRPAHAGVDGAPVAEDDLAEVLYTSGTTGRPKGCLHTHKTVTLAAMNAALAVSITRDERMLMAMPIWHSSPLNNWFGGTVYMGGCVVLMREYHPQKLLQTIQDEGVTAYFGAPVSFFAPLQVVPDFARYTLSSVRCWLYGGGPIGAEMSRKLAQAYGSGQFFQVFGMTETGPLGSALYPEEQLSKAGSIGRAAAPGIELKVVKADGQDARPGETGEIWLRGPSVMKGYLNDPEATRAAFSTDGWYRSGDLVRIDEDGYLFVVDRMKDMIVTGGENVYSKEVEDVLSTHPAVADVAVVGQPHPEWGETVVAHVVLKPGQQVDGEGLSAFLADKLARYKVPRVFQFSEALPRTPTGKLQKFLLRKPVGTAA